MRNTEPIPMNNGTSCNVLFSSVQTAAPCVSHVGQTNTINTPLPAMVLNIRHSDCGTWGSICSNSAQIL